MTKLKTKTILICAAIIYIVALSIFHFDYEYTRYEMVEESTIIVIATILYLLITCAIIAIIQYKKQSKKETVVMPETTSEPIKENEAVKQNHFEEHTQINNMGSQYIGTGVIGLDNCIFFCRIIGFMAIGFGLLCIATYSNFGWFSIMLALYFITGGIGCFILSVLLKAIVTITKAAKLYIDINKKEE